MQRLWSKTVLQTQSHNLVQKSISHLSNVCSVPLWMQPKLVLNFTKSIYHIANWDLSFLSKNAQIPFIWKGVGCIQLTELSGPCYHSYPFFSNTAFQVIPSQWIPVLDYGPSTVLALHFSFVLSNNVPNIFRLPFLFCPDLCLTLLSLPANAASTSHEVKQGRH